MSNLNQEMPKAVQGVVFDMDGLLLETESLYRTAIFQAASEFGYDMTDALHLSLIGTPQDLCDALLRAALGDEFPLRAYDARCHALFTKLTEHALKPKPGVFELLNWLADRQIPVAIATSTRRATATENLARVGLSTLAQRMVAGGEAPRGKPHPDPYLAAVKLLGLAPRDCVAFEDSHTGVRAASAAGLFTVMVPDLLPPTPEMHLITSAIVDDLRAGLQLLEHGTAPAR